MICSKCIVIQTSSLKKTGGLSQDLQKIATDKGFTICDNPASGNCMFYALSDQLQSLKGIQISETELRKKLVKFLRNSPKLVSQWSAGGRSDGNESMLCPNVTIQGSETSNLNFNCILFARVTIVIVRPKKTVMEDGIGRNVPGWNQGTLPN